MSFAPGPYFITCQGTRLSRFQVEDLSLMPKRIFFLPEGNHTMPLILEKVDGDKFTITQMGARYGKAGGDKVVALLIADMGTVGHYEIKSKGNGHTISMDNQYIYMSDEEGPTGKVAKYGDESQATIFTLRSSE